MIPVLSPGGMAKRVPGGVLSKRKEASAVPGELRVATGQP
jgi:hypothetical protein